MSGLLGNLVFLNPWILAGLLTLPALWLLLRVMPPAPRVVTLPSLRFLDGLIPEQQTPSRTPWWILVLRLLIAGLVLLALAQPVMNMSHALPGKGLVQIIIDNGWAAADTWEKQITAAEEIVAQAARENRDIAIITSALPGGQSTWPDVQILDAAKAKGVLKALEPMPWSQDYKAAAEFVSAQNYEGDVTNFWFSHGLHDAGIYTLAGALLEDGSTYYYAPDAAQLPIALKPAGVSAEGPRVGINAPDSLPAGTPITVQALNDKGQVLDQKVVSFTPKHDEQDIQFDIQKSARNQVAEFRLLGRKSVASVMVLDEYSRRKSVGIIGADDETAPKPFIEARYYLTRALEDSATLFTGSAQDILKQNPSMIIMPDTGSLPAEFLNDLENWVNKGGVLLRFAGPDMMQSNMANVLVPVRLRLGSRSMSGALTWDKPAGLSAFPENSPLAGITTSPDIHVSTQILAEPDPELEGKIWAQLEDGTPLITAATQEDGLLVFVHTSASPLWSDLALSGTYVEILRRITGMSGNVQNLSQISEGSLQPVWVFDGYGRKINPPGYVRPIKTAELEDIQINNTRPPGLYGLSGFQKALNLGNTLEPLKAAHFTTLNITEREYGVTAERSFMPPLLYTALILLLVDWMIMIILPGNLMRLRLRRAMVSLFFALMFIVQPAHAQGQLSDVDYADGLYLAYIKTGNSGVDSLAQKGLDSLATVLYRRTSVEPQGVVGLDIERDTLVFFPFIYWPIANTPHELSPKALQNVQSYLDHGGTILFDTRDGNSSEGAMDLVQSSAAKNLRSTISALSIPALQPITRDHVLGKSFYLLDNFTGRYTTGTFWVEQRSLEGGEEVSSVLIGSNDWAGEWANEGNRTRQHEMAMRFGVNVVMYALTGNYKADQVHLPYILERLGQ